MKAVILPRFGGPEVFAWRDMPVPRARPGEIVLRARAAALNYADLLQRRGTYGIEQNLPRIIGYECSGTVAEVGAGVTGWCVGDEACALVSEGAYAEFVVAPAAQVLPVPKGIDLLAAAALPEAACTVWSNVFDLGALNPGESLLVHGGAGGIGSFAIQAAKAIGVRVFATAGSPDKLQRCRDFGADRAISYAEEDFAAVIEAETGGRGVDVILDNMGAAYLDRNVAALASDGRIVMIGLQGGREATIALGTMMRKRASLFTTSLRDRPPQAKARILAGVLRDLWPHLASRAIAPVIDRSFPLAEAEAAHRYMESGSHVGKILLTCPEAPG
ncbi:Quinone oxidoreductase [Bosea sp. LC85]|uniref:NAD(P)H-quinone oxidoreductase n=1 Tax=Bosea sp. LC85 TaxID=1502851 RepID=UPI0004E4597F|nr:NAD(P)H-quinone oxidoreductase [Bosea sp. LC85]KFC65007.1 Quinone oxidoreductase [Bosea sp. LC85]